MSGEKMSQFVDFENGKSQIADRKSQMTGPPTSPLRLSAVSGEKMNQFADFENHKSQISRRPAAGHAYIALNYLLM
jgi:hypothetical protein